MLPDLLSAVLRGLSFIAMAQAAGTLVFLILFGPMLGPSLHAIRRIGAVAAWSALILLPLQFVLEAARMAGAMSGLWDAGLQRFALSTMAADVLVVRIIGVTLLLVAARNWHATARWLGLPGAVLVAVSFSLIGHAAAAPARAVLMPLIGLHLAVACFWFGSLLPLILIAQRERGDVAARIVAKFSRIAAPVVPLLLVSGIAVATVLLRGRWFDVGIYGLGLLGKLISFAALLGIAVLNKWRLGPGLAQGEAARRRFVGAVSVEVGLLASVLFGTAVLTTFASPE